MIGWYSSGGIQRPKQRGQPGQPSPEPVARTRPPTAISAKVATVAASVRLRIRRICSEVRASRVASARATRILPTAADRTPRGDGRPRASCDTGPPMRPDAADGPQRTAEALLDPLRSRVDDVLFGFLDGRRGETAALAPGAAALIDEISRL